MDVIILFVNVNFSSVMLVVLNGHNQTINAFLIIINRFSL